MRKKWTKELLQEEALKYNTRGTFRSGNAAAAMASVRWGIFDEICSHMLPAWQISSGENSTLYIRGFDVDIFVPELNKGIEFDGTYWHSFEKMRSDPKRKNWPDEDILSYHQIKDDYFFSRGIKIIHITDKEWMKDKEKCVKKCLTFLDGKYGF